MMECLYPIAFVRFTGIDLDLRYSDRSPRMATTTAHTKPQYRHVSRVPPSAYAPPCVAVLFRAATRKRGESAAMKDRLHRGSRLLSPVRHSRYDPALSDSAV
jgi:hypothetical protein